MSPRFRSSLGCIFEPDGHPRKFRTSLRRRAWSLHLQRLGHLWHWSNVDYPAASHRRCRVLQQRVWRPAALSWEAMPLSVVDSAGLLVRVSSGHCNSFPRPKSNMHDSCSSFDGWAGAMGCAVQLPVLHAGAANQCQPVHVPARAKRSIDALRRLAPMPISRPQPAQRNAGIQPRGRVWQRCRQHLRCQRVWWEWT